MKLSQLTTQQLSEVLIAITPPLCRIARDPRVMAMLDTLTFSGKDQPPLSCATTLWEKLLPLLLTDLSDDLFAVLAALTEKSPEELRKQTGMTTITDLMSIWDGELTAFFTSAGSAAQEKS